MEDETEEAWGAQQLARWALALMRGGIEGDAQVRVVKAALAARGVAPHPGLFYVQFAGLDDEVLVRSAPRESRVVTSHHQQPTERHVDPAPHHAQDARALARRDPPASRTRRAFEQMLARALNQCAAVARCVP